MPAETSCDTCRFWAADSDGSYEGTCRRYAPRPYSSSGDRKSGVWWPSTCADEWCGEHHPAAMIAAKGNDDSSE